MKPQNRPKIEARHNVDGATLGAREHEIIAELRARGFPTDAAERYLREFDALYHARMRVAKRASFGVGLSKV
jgi:hypothetical protein